MQKGLRKDIGREQRKGRGIRNKRTAALEDRQEGVATVFK